MTATKPLVENWNELTTRLIWAYDGPVREHFLHSAYRPEGVVAWFIRNGSVTLEFANHRESYQAGCWIFPKHEKGMQHFSKDAVMLSVRFIVEWKEGTPLFNRSKTVEIPQDCAKSLSSLGERLARLFEGISFETATLERMPQQLDTFLDQQRLFYAWLVAYAKTMLNQGLEPILATQLDERVSSAASIMDRRNTQETFTEQQIAELVGLSVTQLNRLFVGHLGMTIAEYWETRKKRLAVNALQETSRSIKAISYDLGFSSLSHFSVWVKKRFGVSPRKLRQMTE
ncbi:helix-turn-helix domain-containing protein [Coraliomargarita parva]|uniref:helix-turn-helix domain-containing protein n=1 Tax=Coraliomargarita parva TaxID=3014050 RepID=UPI0022B429AE|nr:AraC family transcriptional regulator [Coraliomargarita parva]